jgi:hypothetical protein
VKGIIPLTFVVDYPVGVRLTNLESATTPTRRIVKKTAAPIPRARLKSPAGKAVVVVVMVVVVVVHQAVVVHVVVVVQ